MTLDNTDLKILKIVTSNARLSYRQIAKRLGVSTVTALARLKRMEENGLIKCYTAIIDHSKLGYDLTAVIEVVTTKGKMIEVEKQISNAENVCAVYDVTGGTDIIVIAKFKTRSELSKFVKELSSKPHVNSTNTHIVLNTIKEDFKLI